MIKLRCASLPSFKMAGTFKHHDDWTRWRWVRMSDLIQACNEGNGGRWSGQSLGGTFVSVNLFDEKFWHYIEGDDEANFTKLKIADCSELLLPIPFDNPKLMVPRVWAENVHKLVRLGVVNIHHTNGIAYTWLNANKLEQIENLLKLKL